MHLGAVAVDVAAAAVRVAGPAVVLVAPAAMVELAAARRVAIQFVRNAPIDLNPNKCRRGEPPA
jgi:hypothetical protein